MGSQHHAEKEMGRARQGQPLRDGTPSRQSKLPLGLQRRFVPFLLKVFCLWKSRGLLRPIQNLLIEIVRRNPSSGPRTPAYHEVTKARESMRLYLTHQLLRSCGQMSE